jgi:hypothetical protein
MSLAHSRLVVMVVYLCFLTRLLAVVLPELPLPLELPVVELLLEVVLPVEVALVVALLEALAQVVAVLVDSTDLLGLPDWSCSLGLFDSLRKCLVTESNRSIAVRCMVWSRQKFCFLLLSQ